MNRRRFSPVVNESYCYASCFKIVAPRIKVLYFVLIGDYVVLSYGCTPIWERNEEEKKKKNENDFAWCRRKRAYVSSIFSFHILLSNEGIGRRISQSLLLVF